ncbi:MAG TPA: hypothetical protein PLZ51_10275 [Aggregatilineales bacterium]|nr:hypothetical protein [Aggregatilineales bacterium]
MAKDIGEEIVGAWLRHVEGCDFVQYNVPTRKKQGEIDVVGLNLQTHIVYVCEVATHTQGLEYTRYGVTNTYNGLLKKFNVDIEYAKKYLSEFTQKFMFWSPVVRLPVGDATKHNIFLDLAHIQKEVFTTHGVEIEMVINENYLNKVNQLKNQSGEETAASEYPVFRMLQIIGSLERHVAKLHKRNVTDSQQIIKDLQDKL